MIDIANESGQEVDELRLVSLARFALDLLRIHPQAYLSLALVDESVMASLHEQHLHLPGPTDVMSWPSDELRAPDSGDEPLAGDFDKCLGDIVLCPQVIAEQAPDNGRSIEDEMDYLLIHGLLHLLGHDHAEPEEKAVMFSLNDRIIAAWQRQRHSA